MKSGNLKNLHRIKSLTEYPPLASAGRGTMLAGRVQTRGLWRLSPGIQLRDGGETFRLRPNQKWIDASKLQKRR